MKEYDVVYGVYLEIKQSFFRKVGSNINKMMSECFIGKPKDIRATSFFVMKRFVVDEMLRYKSAYPYIEGLILRCTKNIGNVKVQQRERFYGKSNYNFRKLLKLWINGFTAFSIKPLRLATIAGVLASMIGFLYGIVIIINKILHPNIVVGWSSLMAVNLLLGGMILFVLGLLGEYVGRIYMSMNNTPQYVIRETINIEKNE